MKILFVHEVSWFNKVVFEMHDFPELLSLEGHEVYFLDFDEGQPRAQWRCVTTTESRAHAGSSVHVTTGPRVLPGILGRLLATVLQPVFFICLWRKVRPDVVITYSIPTSGWQITFLCNFFGIPIVARVIDVAHVLRQTSFRGLIKLSERLVYRRADFVTTHNEVLRDYCCALGAKPPRCSVIYPGVDLDRFQPGVPPTELQKKLGLSSSDRTLLFMGTLFRFSGLFELLTSLAPALHRDPDLKFLILGDGEDLERLQGLARKFGLERKVIFTGRVEYRDLADYLRLGRVAVLPFEANLVTNAALPAKVLQYLASGLPTVATQLDGLQSVVGADNGVVFTRSVDTMAEAVVELFSDPERILLLSKQGRRFTSLNCDWVTQIRTFERLLVAVHDTKSR